MKRGFHILLVAGLISAPLVWFGLRPDYLVHVILQPSSEAEVQVLSKDLWTLADANGIVFFDFKASLSRQSEALLFLEIRPAADPEYHRQREGYSVARGIVNGVAQLGTAKWPIRQNEQYAFRLVTGSGAPLLDGRILAEAHPRAAVAPLLLAAIGVLASVLEALNTLRREGVKGAGRDA